MNFLVVETHFSPRLQSSVLPYIDSFLLLEEFSLELPMILFLNFEKLSMYAEILSKLYDFLKSKKIVEDSTQKSFQMCSFQKNRQL